MTDAFADLTRLGVTALGVNTFGIAQRGGRGEEAKKNQEGLVYYQWSPKGIPNDQQLGGTLTSPPAVTSASGELHFAARGQDLNVYYKRGLGNGGWESCAPGGTTPSTPAICIVEKTIHVFARGQHDQLWHTQRQVDKTGWTDWASSGAGIPNLAIGMKSAPSVVAFNGRIDVVVQGNDDAVWHLLWNGSSWSTWNSLGGEIKGAPTCCWWNFGPTFHVFGRGKNDQVWHKIFTQTSASGQGNWVDWYQDVPNTPVPLQSVPVAVSSADQRVDIFATGGDVDAWTTRWTPATGWQQWEAILINSAVKP